MLKVGFAQRDITPELGLQIPGNFKIRPADGIIDPLYARACVIDDGKTTMAFCVMDILLVTGYAISMIRKRASESTGIPEENIWVAATHIHTGSPTDRKTGVPGSWDEDNIIITAKKTADAIFMAWSNRVEAKIGYGCQDEYAVAFNRRYYMKDGKLGFFPKVLCPDVDRPAGPIDPQVAVLRVDNMEGEPIGAIVNFAVHADVVGGTKYCADYIGELARTMKKVYGEDFGVVFMNGCCGDINHIDVIGGTNLPLGKQHIKMGRILAGDAIAILERTATSEAVELGTANTEFHGTRRRPSDEDYKWALETIENEDATIIDRRYADQWKNMYENPLSDPDLKVNACSIKFLEPMKNGEIPGDVALCSMPGEIFVEIGLELKEKSPFANTIICELANGYFGYIATSKAIDEGGYETRINMSTNMGKDTGSQLIENQLKLLNSLKK